MRTILLTFFLLLTVQEVAQAQYLKIDVTYTNGQILSGPLSADLTELPPSVNATFLLNGTGAGSYGMADVLQSSLVFGDASWNAADIVEFSTTLEAAGGTPSGLAVIALTYEYAETDTSTVNGRVVRNFPLDIEGTDIATGQAFHYRYDISSETVTAVPEPSGIILGAFLGLVMLGRRKFGKSSWPSISQTNRSNCPQSIGFITELRMRSGEFIA